jgi:hypothetical protein
MAVPVTSSHIYYPSTINPITGGLTPQVVTAIDLRKVSSWSDGELIGSAPLATIRLRIQGHTTDYNLVVPKAEYEAAKITSLGAGG